jgi:hypothetical protein
MTKIFSNIAKKAPNLLKRYDDSTVTNELTTFNALRNEGGTNILYKSNLPRNVYNLYTDPATTPSPLEQNFTTSTLVEPENVVRIRRSKFYDAFRITNSNLTAVNNTLIEIKPYTPANADEIYSVDTSRMVQNSQQNPIVSGPRDVVRMQRYLRSAEGLQFKLSQQILQAGNTFGQTRGYNPVSVETMALNYRNATLFQPLERIPRILTSNATTNPLLAGRLQRETTLDAQSKLRLKFVGGAAPQTRAPILGALNNLLRSTLRDRINNINIPLPRFVNDIAQGINRAFGTNLSAGNSINVGQVNRQLDNIANSADAIRRGLNINNATLEKDQTAYDALYLNNVWPLMKQNDGTIVNFQGAQGTKEQYLQRARSAIRKAKDINNFNKSTVEYPEDQYRSSATYTEDVRAGTTTGVFAGVPYAKYVRDEMNLVNGGATTDAKNLNGAHENTDYVKFRIVVPGVFDKGINFRAFIEDINHQSKGQYDEVRYVGRPERFITYKGMNRSVTFSMYLVAFGQDEIDTVWTRANMLNKLTFPIDATGGFMTPPLAKITIGNVFLNQTGYFESVDMRLQDIPWDIDKELPQAVKLNMTFNIIENGFVTQKQTNPFAPGSQIFGEQDITTRTNQLFSDLGQASNNVNNLVQNMDFGTIPQFNFSDPRAGLTFNGGAGAGAEFLQRDAARRQTEIQQVEARQEEARQRYARQQELNRQAILNNQLQGMSEDTGVGPFNP